MKKATQGTGFLRVVLAGADGNGGLAQKSDAGLFKEGLNSMTLTAPAGHLTTRFEWD